MRQLSRKFSRRLWRNAKVSSTDIHATYGSLFYQIAARKARHPKIVSNEGLQWRPSPAHLRISGIFLPLCTAIYAVCQGWRLIMSCLSLVGSVPCAWLQLESKSNTQESRHDCSGIGAAGCANGRQDRVLGGALIGGGTGALIGGLAGQTAGAAVAGGLIGAAAGAIIADATRRGWCYYRRHHRRHYVRC